MTTPIQYHDEAGRVAWGAVMNDNAPEPVPAPFPTEQPSRLDQVLTWGAKKAKLCGYGPDMNWSVRLTDALFVDCGCCWVMRGIVVGLMAGGIVGLVLGALLGRFL